MHCAKARRSHSWVVRKRELFLILRPKAVSQPASLVWASFSRQFSSMVVCRPSNLGLLAGPQSPHRGPFIQGQMPNIVSEGLLIQFPCWHLLTKVSLFKEISHILLWMILRHHSLPQSPGIFREWRSPCYFISQITEMYPFKNKNKNPFWQRNVQKYWTFLCLEFPSKLTVHFPGGRKSRWQWFCWAVYKALLPLVASFLITRANGKTLLPCTNHWASFTSSLFYLHKDPVKERYGFL